METITKINTTKEKLVTEFESSKESLFGNTDVRKRAVEAFSRQGIPNRKNEEYRYLNMELALKGDFTFVNSKKLSKQQIEDAVFLEDAIVVVIENGVFNSEHFKTNSLPDGLNILNIGEASTDEIFQKHYSKYADINSDSFIALNTTLASGGVFIHVSKSAVIETPIHIVHITSVAENTILNCRNLIVVEQNAQVQLVESYETVDSSAKSFTNALTEIVVEDNAMVDHYKIQDEKEVGNLVSTTQIIQKKQSQFSTHTFTLSGALVRNNLNIVLDDQFSESHLNGLYLTNGTQVVDNHTLVDHRKPNCSSNELYKGIIDDKSTATFNGKIFVRKDAQQTNAFQSNKNILLSDDGTINTKPQLEIYANDVKCSHGTSTGKLNEDQLFYLRARGLSEASAKKVLMYAFASELINRIKIDELKEYVEALVSQQL